MKLFYCLFATVSMSLALVIGAAIPCFGQDTRGMKRIYPPEEVGNLYDDSYALVIGIDNYVNVRHLRYASGDAKGVASILRSTFGFDERNVTVLTNEDATDKRILQAFDRLIRDSRGNDRVFVFFSGHGIDRSLAGGVEKGYILPYDYDPRDITGTAISTDQLNEYSNSMGAKHVFFVVDACYGGLIFSKGVSVNASAGINVLAKRRVRRALTAGGPNQEVHDKGPSGHSVFTYYFIAGLENGDADRNGDGVITSSELSQYVFDNVVRETGGLETPEYGTVRGGIQMANSFFHRNVCLGHRTKWQQRLSGE